jgi:hypothetical protein
MIFAANSRYLNIPTAKWNPEEGVEIVYLRRRFVPQPESLFEFRDHVVVQGDRIDNLAARHLTDPELFWRLCDANRAMRPADLTEEPGRRLRITMPEGVLGVTLV